MQCEERDQLMPAELEPLAEEIRVYLGFRWGWGLRRVRAPRCHAITGAALDKSEPNP